MWLTSLVVTIGFIVFLFVGQLLPVFMDIGNATEPELPWAPWSREANLVGLTDDELMLKPTSDGDAPGGGAAAALRPRRSAP